MEININLLDTHTNFPIFPKKIYPWLYLYTTYGFCNSVISSSNMFTNFTSCIHAESANYSDYVLLSVIILWVFDDNVIIVNPSVVTSPTELFMVYLLVE